MMADGKQFAASSGQSCEASSASGGAEAGEVPLSPGLASWASSTGEQAPEGRRVSSAGNSAESGPRLYPQRWVQLFYLAALAFISDWVCFAVAAEPGEWYSIYHKGQADLIDIFLFTNVLFCGVEPYIAERYGLRKVVVTGAFVMAIGCILRAGTRKDTFLPFSDAMPLYWKEVLGTVLVGAAQPFFQCTPPLLSLVWFGTEERALSTSIAINANQIGIAMAFLTGGNMAGTEAGLNGYFSLIAVMASLCAVGSFFQFQDAPPTPPSISAAAKAERLASSNKADVSVLDFPRLVCSMLRTRGFHEPLIAFMGSITVTNAISSFLDITLHEHAGFGQESIYFAGALFQIFIMCGSIFIGNFVDRTKFYKASLIMLLVSTLFLLVPLGFSGKAPKQLVVISLLLLGSAVGPVQPVAAELAVEVAYPIDENSIVAFQQVCGNCFSALSIPVLDRSAKWRLAGAFGGDYLLLEILVIGTLVIFLRFNAPLKRLAVDTGRIDEVELRTAS